MICHADIDTAFFHANHVFHAGDGCCRIAKAAGIQKLQRHDFGAPVHAGNAKTIVAISTDDARDMSAVAIVVVRIGVVVGRVDAEYVIDVTIAIVVFTVTGSFLRIAP